VVKIGAIVLAGAILLTTSTLLAGFYTWVVYRFLRAGLHPLMAVFFTAMAAAVLLPAVSQAVTVILLDPGCRTIPLADQLKADFQTQLDGSKRYLELLETTENMLLKDIDKRRNNMDRFKKDKVNVVSGIYVYRVESGVFTHQSKFIVIR
jgi:hypothetical protein